MIRTERKEDDGIRSSAEEAEMLKPCGSSLQSATSDYDFPPILPRILYHDFPSGGHMVFSTSDKRFIVRPKSDAVDRIFMKSVECFYFFQRTGIQQDDIREGAG